MNFHCALQLPGRACQSLVYFKRLCTCKNDLDRPKTREQHKPQKPLLMKFREPSGPTKRSNSHHRLPVGRIRTIRTNPRRSNGDVPELCPIACLLIADLVSAVHVLDEMKFLVQTEGCLLSCYGVSMEVGVGVLRKPILHVYISSAVRAVI